MWKQGRSDTIRFGYEGARVCPLVERLTLESTFGREKGYYGLVRLKFFLYEAYIAQDRGYNIPPQKIPRISIPATRDLHMDRHLKKLSGHFI